MTQPAIPLIASSVEFGDGEIITRSPFKPEYMQLNPKNGRFVYNAPLAETVIEFHLSDGRVIGNWPVTGGFRFVAKSIEETMKYWLGDEKIARENTARIAKGNSAKKTGAQRAKEAKRKTLEKGRSIIAQGLSTLADLWRNFSVDVAKAEYLEQATARGMEKRAEKNIAVFEEIKLNNDVPMVRVEQCLAMMIASRVTLESSMGKDDPMTKIMRANVKVIEDYIATRNAPPVETPEQAAARMERVAAATQTAQPEVSEIAA